MNSINITQAIQNLSVAFIPFMLAMIMHEIAHGWVASKMGDQTAKMLGRLTLNPVRHLDPMGTLCFIITAISSPFIFGWAKPVPINPRNFRNFKKGMILVSLAGALTNFILAFLFTLTFVLLVKFGIVPANPMMNQGSFLVKMLQSGIIINCILGWFNLMPIPPLDGSKIVATLLPPQLANSYMSIERYGMIIILLLLVTGVIGKILWPLVTATASLFYDIVFLLPL